MVELCKGFSSSVKGHSHVAKWISEFTLSVANDDSGDALLPSFILAAFRVSPVRVAVLFREDLALQRDQVARLAVAAKGGEIEGD